MAKPIIYGPSYSTYVRTARLACEEKGAAYELLDVAMLKGEHKNPAHLKRHPFGYVPSFEHDGFELYETSAISRYIDRALPGTKLQAADPRALARMDQVIAIADSYGYPSLITRIVMQRVVAPMMGGTPDDKVVESGLANARTTCAELERLMAGAAFLAGDQLSLADLHVAPIMAYAVMTPEGKGLLEQYRGLQSWWQRMAARPSMAATQPRFD
jgi:glutathione S-transferase